MRVLFLILTALNYLSFCTSRFCNNKKWLLFFELLAKVFTITSFIVMKQTTAFLTMSLTIVWLVLLFIRENSKAKWPLWLNAGLFSGFVVVYIVIMISTYENFGSILVSTTTFLALIANWWFKPQIIRGFGFVGITTYLSYQLYFLHNWVSLIGEICVFITTLIPFVMYIKNHKKDNEVKSYEKKLNF